MSSLHPQINAESAVKKARFTPYRKRDIILDGRTLDRDTSGVVRDFLHGDKNLWKQRHAETLAKWMEISKISANSGYFEFLKLCIHSHYMIKLIRLIARASSTSLIDVHLPNACLLCSKPNPLEYY